MSRFFSFWRDRERVEYPADVLGEELDQFLAEEEVAHESGEQHEGHHSLGKLRRHACDEIRLQTDEENDNIDGLHVTASEGHNVVGDTVGAVHNVAAKQPVKNEEEGEAEIRRSIADANPTTPRQSIAEEKPRMARRSNTMSHAFRRMKTPR